MEKQTAYCKHCQCNTPVVNSIPPKWWSRNLFWIILIALFLPIIGLIIIGIIALMPSGNLYCEKCGSYVCHKSEMKNKCVYCDAELAPGTTFCPNCGKKFKALKNSVVCKKCKTENSLSSKFCTKCGTKLPENETQTVQVLERGDMTQKNTALYVLIFIILIVCICGMAWSFS